MARRPPLIDRQKWYEKVGYVPRNGARAFDEAVDAGARFVSMFAFPQAGKSYHAAKHVEPYILQPDNHGWLVAPTYPLGSKEFGYIYNDFANTGILKLATRRHNDPRSGHMELEFPWGSFVRVVSADNPSSLRMEQLDWIILCEASALPSNVYERFLYSRVELRHGRVLVPTTPAGFNWVYDAFRLPSLKTVDFTYGPWVNCRRERVGGVPNAKYDPLYWSTVVSAVEEFGEVLEPGVHTDEAIERARKLLPRPAFAEQFGGDFASYAGLVYPFDPTQHECEPFKVPEEWTHIVGWDHGADNPTAVVFGSYGPDGTVYWWDEIYVAGLSAREYTSMVRGKLGLKAPAAIVIDASAKQMRIELMNHGLVTTTPYDKQIEARITKVTAMMRDGRWRVMRGRCPNLVKEILSWEWDDKDTHKPRPKQRCHALDAMGYALLVPVPLPGQREHVDPDVLPGEDPRHEFVWKGWRKRMREHEQDRQARDLEDILDSSPFDERGMHPEEYEFVGEGV